MASGNVSSSSCSSRKRPAEDIDNYSDIGGHENANIHGVLMELSPVKKGKRSNFFEGQMSDGTSRMRFVGFKAEQRKKLVDFSQSGKPVALKDCEVKVSRQGHQMKILLKNSTEISISMKTINVSNEAESGPVLLTEVEKMPELVV